jgi:hypothetical protein
MATITIKASNGRILHESTHLAVGVAAEHMLNENGYKTRRIITGEVAVSPAFKLLSRGRDAGKTADYNQCLSCKLYNIASRNFAPERI